MSATIRHRSGPVPISVGLREITRDVISRRQCTSVGPRYNTTNGMGSRSKIFFSGFVFFFCFSTPLGSTLPRGGHSSSHDCSDILCAFKTFRASHGGTDSTFSESICSVLRDPEFSTTSSGASVKTKSRTDFAPRKFFSSRPRLTYWSLAVQSVLLFKETINQLVFGQTAPTAIQELKFELYKCT